MMVAVVAGKKITTSWLGDVHVDCQGKVINSKINSKTMEGSLSEKNNNSNSQAR